MSGYMGCSLIIRLLNKNVPFILKDVFKSSIGVYADIKSQFTSVVESFGTIDPMQLDYAHGSLVNNFGIRLIIKQTGYKIMDVNSMLYCLVLKKFRAPLKIGFVCATQVAFIGVVLAWRRVSLVGSNTLLIVKDLNTRAGIVDLSAFTDITIGNRSEEHTSELQSRPHLVCRLLLEKKNQYLN